MEFPAQNSQFRFGTRVQWSHCLGPFNYGAVVAAELIRGSCYIVIRIDMTHQCVMVPGWTVRRMPGCARGTPVCWIEDVGFGYGTVADVAGDGAERVAFVLEDRTQRLSVRRTIDIFPVFPSSIPHVSFG
jgi:hypothetical protein